jgi:hypothetical protein
MHGQQNLKSALCSYYGTETAQGRWVTALRQRNADTQAPALGKDWTLHTRNRSAQYCGNSKSNGDRDRHYKSEFEGKENTKEFYYKLWPINRTVPSHADFIHRRLPSFAFHLTVYTFNDARIDSLLPAGFNLSSHRSFQSPMLNQAQLHQYRGVDKSLARPRRNQITETEDFAFHISYL